MRATRSHPAATPGELPAGGRSRRAEPDGGYGAPSFLEELRLKLHGKYLVLAIAIGAALLVLAVVADPASASAVASARDASPQSRAMRSEIRSRHA